ncbi:hypothetical protein ACFWY6_14855 [Streptomyces sp. NPDC059037]|uniref:hypothetical protein n=1 Tax=Streptomyces sp. NPDC059037 TaxID=3346710 RepID=UPI003691B215
MIRGLIDRWTITPVDTRRALLRTLLRGVWAYPKMKDPDGEVIVPYAVPVAVWEEPPATIGRRAAA